MTAGFQQRRGFIEDVVGRHEPAAGLGRTLKNRACPWVHGVALDQQRVKAARVHKRLSAGRRSGRFLHWSATVHLVWHAA